MSVSVDEEAVHMTAEEKAAALSILEPPKGFEDWTRRKKLEFERKRIVKLQ